MKKQITIGVIIFLVILIIVPFAINLFIQLPAQFDVVGEPVNWLMFWPTYISAAASFFMIYVTYLSLKQNRKQLDEMKRQWDYDHKKELVAYLVVHNKYFYLCIKNTSIVPIINIHASITHIPSGIHKPYAEFLNNFNNSIFSIEAGGCRYINTYVLNSCSPGYSSNNDFNADDYLGITLTYDDDKDKEIPLELSFSLGKILKDELEAEDRKS